MKPDLRETLIIALVGLTVGSSISLTGLPLFTQCLSVFVLVLVFALMRFNLL